jgi:class 3 adenylate cyclase
MVKLGNRGGSVRRLLIRAGLRFDEPADEASFVESYVLRHRTVIQALAVGCGLLQYAYFLTDRMIDPARADTTHAIRGATFLFIALIALALGLPAVRRWTEAVIVMALAATSGTMVLIMRVLDADMAFPGAGFILMILVATTLFPLRMGYFLAAMLGILAAAAAGLSLAPRDGGQLVTGVSVVAAAGMGLVAVARRELVARREWLLTREVAVAHGRIQDLLHTMLPHDVVERIQKGETAIADAYGEVAIVFADLVGFTELSRRFSASHLVELLNRIFSAFDRLAERHGLERIKTIGDCYMAATGISRGGGDPGRAAAAFALELQGVVAQISEEFDYPLDARVGLHVGPVVAGVIGVQRPAFDCWGESVNLAARLETAAAPGDILVSEAAYWRLKGEYAVTPLEEVDLKGIGRTRVFRLERSARTENPSAAAAE